MTLVWRRLLAVLPERRGVLLLDDTAFLKQRRHSVGVTRQYASARHHVTNCQVAVTAALWTHARAWLVGAESYVSESWLTPEARTRARIPAARQFSEKSRLALRLVQRVRAAQLEIEAVVANAGYGNVVALTALDRAGQSYVMGITSDTTVFDGVPSVRPGRRRRKPVALALSTRRSPRFGPLRTPCRRARGGGLREAMAANANGAPNLRRCAWCPSPSGACIAGSIHVGCCANAAATIPAGCGSFFSNLPATTPLTRLARLAHQRWAIEQQYSDLKTELGLDRFEAARFRAGNITSCSVPSCTLSAKRTATTGPVALTFPQIHAMVKKSSPASSLCRGPGTSRGSTLDVVIWTIIRSGSDKVVNPKKPTASPPPVLLLIVASC